MSLYVCKRDIPKKTRNRWKSFEFHLIDSYSDVLFFYSLSAYFPHPSNTSSFIKSTMD